MTFLKQKLLLTTRTVACSKNKFIERDSLVCAFLHSSRTWKENKEGQLASRRISPKDKCALYVLACMMLLSFERFLSKL